MKPFDVTELEERIKATGKSLAELKTENFTEEFLKIIHRPGWTSVAESLFVRHMLSSVEQHAKAQSASAGSFGSEPSGGRSYRHSPVRSC